jgi:hypothetical protein
MECKTTTEKLQEYADDPTSALLAAVRAGDLPLVAELVRKGAAVDGDPLGLSPIAVAILAGRPDCAWLLLELGARPDVSTPGPKDVVGLTDLPGGISLVGLAETASFEGALELADALARLTAERRARDQRKSREYVPAFLLCKREEN